MVENARRRWYNDKKQRKRDIEMDNRPIIETKNYLKPKMPKKKKIAIASSAAAAFLCLCAVAFWFLHPHTYNKWYISKESTCTETGEWMATCFCGETKIISIKPSGHRNEIVEGKSATCTDDGLSEGKRCSICSAILLVQESIPALGHTEQILASYEATCTQEGLTEGKKCSVCKEILLERKVIPAKGHQYGEWYETVAPSESKNGEKRRDCENCDKYETSIVAMLSHSHDRWEEITLEAVAPTCIETGLTQGKKCSGCGEILVAQEIVPTVWHTEVVDAGYDATKSEDGLTDGKHCGVCGEILEEQKVIYAIGSQGLAYNITSDTTCEITGIGTCTDTELVIPMYIDDYAVTAIGERAFYDNNDLTSVVIDDNVVNIEERAFWGCTGLTNLTIGSNVSIIGKSAFSECNGLTEVFIPGSVTSIGEFSFWRCQGLTSLTIDDSIVSKDRMSIGSCAFAQCYNLENVVLSDNIYKIGEQAFGGCNMYAIQIPASVTSIGEGVFNYCLKLTDITVASGNYEYTSYEGVLYTYDFRTLICYPAGKTESIYEIYWWVTAIDNLAFAHCKNLTSIKISDRVTSIGTSAFHNCNSLTNITIPDSVTSIGASAFEETSFYNDNANWENGNVLYIGNHLVKARSDLEGDYEIKQETLSIADSAFDDCDVLTSIEISESVTSIGNSAFSYCSRLTSITIPKSVTSIGEGAFLYCSSLNGITYNGTIIEWKIIFKETDWNYNTPDYTIYCTDGTIAKNGTITYN